MAAASVQLSPYTSLASMATGNNRREPLSALHNAGNSPFRGASGLKRARPQFGNADGEAGKEPPTKRQIFDLEGPVTPRKAQRVATGNTPVQRKHAARVREPTRQAIGDPARHAIRDPGQAVGEPARHVGREPVRQPARPQEGHGESLERLRAWQKHNEKAFPTYVFYFDSVPDVVRSDCAKDLKPLGAVSKLREHTWMFADSWDSEKPNSSHEK